MLKFYYYRNIAAIPKDYQKIRIQNSSYFSLNFFRIQIQRRLKTTIKILGYINYISVYKIVSKRWARSVVRTSRRSSEPQTVGSKPIGPVIHMGSNILSNKLIG